MRGKTLTTSFLDFSGRKNAQNHFLGGLETRKVAYPDKSGDKYWVKAHMVNNGLYPVSDLSDLLPNVLRQIFYASQYTDSYDVAVQKLKKEVRRI